MIGGVGNKNQLVTECILFDNITTGQFSCKKVCVHVHVYVVYTKCTVHLHVLSLFCILVVTFISIISHCLQIPLPESVTGRYAHSLTAVTMSPHCVWLVIVGGFKEVVWKDVGGGVKKPMHTYITDTNRLTMIIELGKIIIIKITL